MLKEIFNKEEKSKEEESRELKQKTLIYLIILVVGMSFLFINTNEKGNNSSNTKPKNENTVTITKDDIIKKFENINDNYSLNITQNINDENIVLKIDTDGNLTSYISDSIDKGGYIIYKDKYFVPGDNNNFMIVNNVKKLVPSSIYDLDFIKSLISYCDFIDNNTCKIKYSDYLKEYNYRYKTSYEIEEYDTFLINLTYSAKYITKISYDYTLLNKMISNNESNVNYLIRISNINNNNFSDQFEYFDNLIEKKN